MGARSVGRIAWRVIDIVSSLHFIFMLARACQLSNIEKENQAERWDGGVLWELEVLRHSIMFIPEQEVLIIHIDRCHMSTLTNGT